MSARCACRPSSVSASPAPTVRLLESKQSSGGVGRRTRNFTHTTSPRTWFDETTTMPSILEACEDLFGVSCLYKVLGVEKSARENERECPARPRGATAASKGNMGGKRVTWLRLTLFRRRFGCFLEDFGVVLLFMGWILLVTAWNCIYAHTIFLAWAS